LPAHQSFILGFALASNITTSVPHSGGRLLSRRRRRLLCRGRLVRCHVLRWTESRHRHRTRDTTRAPVQQTFDTGDVSHRVEGYQSTTNSRISEQVRRQ
jgi:hypothetical protein